MKNLLIHRNSRFPRLMLISLLCISFSFVSCDKDDDDDVVVPTVPPPLPSAPENPTISFTDGSGTLTAIQSRTFQKIPFFGGFTSIDLGLAVAVFYDDPTTGTLTEAGTVECNSEALTKNNNNSYVFTPGLGNTTGIDFDQFETNWEVSGSSAGGNVPALSLTNSNAFPDIEKISSETTIDRTMEYALTTTRVWSSDSIIYMIGGIYHTVEAGIMSYTFTAEELSTLSAGQNFAQITGYNVYSVEEGGNTYHMVNETVVTESITLQ